MTWTLRRTSSPQSLAVSLDEAKAHLRVGGNAQDELISLQIEAATEQFERDINRAIIQTTWVQSHGGFPDEGGRIDLMMQSATSITSISYIDEAGDSQSLVSGTDFELDMGRNAVTCLRDSDGWPDTFQASSGSGRDAVTITFVCGTSDTNRIPRIYKQAILLAIGKAYYDPAMESAVNTDGGATYELLVNKLMRASYP